MYIDLCKSNPQNTLATLQCGIKGRMCECDEVDNFGHCFLDLLNGPCHPNR